MTGTNGNSQPLRILHCRSSDARHGPEQSLEHLFPALQAEAVTPSLLALYRRPERGPVTHPWVADARSAGVDAMQIDDPGPVSIHVMRRMARLINRSGADVIHSHDYKTNILGGLVARRSNRSVPWVATVHLHTATSRRLQVYRALDLFLLRLADRVVTVSRDQRRLLLQRGVDRRRLVLVPNVIDADSFAAEAAEPDTTRESLGVPPDAPLIALIGRLTTQKGVDSFLEASGIVCEACPTARFIVAGTGPDREALEGSAAELGLSRSLQFLGYRNDVASLLAASDVVVLPSRSEGLPIVLLEALAVGRPVVATAVGGVPDLLEHDRTALLVPPHRPDAVADSVIGLVRNPQRASRLGAAGGRHVRRNFTPVRAARRMASVYRTVVSERS